MYCIKCGTENDDDSRFCTKCGTNTRDDTSDINKKKIISPNLDNIKIKIKNRRTLKIIATILILSAILLVASVFFLYANNGDNNVGNDDNIRVGNDDNIHVGNDDNIRVTIFSIPPKANIYINEEWKGVSPETISLPVGSYNLKMNMTGYSGIKSKIDVTPDTERLEVNVTFEPINQ